MTVITLILFFERRCIRFLYNIFSSENQLYTSMIKYSLTNCDSTLSEKIRYPMHKYEFDMHGSFTSLLIKLICTVTYLGFPFGGWFKIFLEKWGYLHGVKRHAARGEATRLLGRFGGMLPRESF